MAVHQGAGLIDVSTLGKLIVRGPGRRRLPQPPLPEPLRQPEARPDPLRGARRRCRADHRRRDHLPPRRRVLLRDHDIERRRRRRELVRVVAGRMGHGRAHDRRQPGPVGLQPRRPAGAGDPLRAHRSRLLERVVRLPGRQAARRSPGYRACCCGSASSASSGTSCTARRPSPSTSGTRLLDAGAAARDPALRPRAPARAATSEAPHPRRPGHRRRVEPARGRDAVDRQVRQGGGLHRPLGSGGGSESAATRTCSSASRSTTAPCRPRAPRWCTDGRPVGRVTSSRFSPLLERTIGMAWVPVALAEDGQLDHARRRRPAAQRPGPDRPVLRPRPGAAALMSFEFLAADVADRRAARFGRWRAARSSGHNAASVPSSTNAPAGGWWPATEPWRRRPPPAGAPSAWPTSPSWASSSCRVTRRPSPRSSPSSPAGRRARARAGGAAPTRSGGARSTTGRVLAVTLPEATARGARRARGGGRGAGVRLGAPSSPRPSARTPSSAPLARETFARATALDLRPDRFADGAFAPVSVARTPGMVLREGGDRFLHLFGAGYAHYTWTVFIDAAEAPRRPRRRRRRLRERAAAVAADA